MARRLTLEEREAQLSPEMRARFQEAREVRERFEALKSDRGRGEMTDQDGVRLSMFQQGLCERDSGPWPPKTAPSCTIPDCTCKIVRPAAVERRLPGQAPDRAETLLKIQNRLAEIRLRDLSAAGQFLFKIHYGKPEDMFRWRVQLSCGCVHDEMTHGPDEPPSMVSTYDQMRRYALPAGERTCLHPRAKGDHLGPYRTITKYLSVKVEHHPADDPDAPAPFGIEECRRRKPQTVAYWRVKLCCGHVDSFACEPEWRPIDGFKPASRALFQKQKEAHENDRAIAHPAFREHWQRMLDLGWPRPSFPETECGDCSNVRPIVAYQRVGWLVPRSAIPKPAGPPQPPSQDVLKRRLRKLEAEAARLRDMIDP